ncbi:MAG: helix-turn-helix transcriptional regulator [Prevotella sp.]|nr:helix-turn-helix transcriptional regulator [Prevotella sp.]
MNHRQPMMAIVCPNSLTAIGMRQLLTSVLPTVQVEVYTSVEELVDDQPERFFHFFVDISVLLAHRGFFNERKKQTIVLTTSQEHAAQLPGFHCLCVTVPEKQLVRNLLAIQQQGHPHGHPSATEVKNPNMLSAREIEVLALVAQGFINKEIADKLNISLTTVITHRKNITEKLGLRSVSALTIYAVMNGYVELDKI